MNNQFEYFVINMGRTNDELQEILNIYGAHGWIMWHMDQFRIIFFREKTPSVKNIGLAQADPDVNP